MKLRVAGVVQESIVDGPGIRYVIFTQGCYRECFGCHNKATQDIAGGYLVEVDELVNEILSQGLLDGVTISGGEAFLQTEAVGELVEKLKEHKINVWIYSGYTFEELLNYGDKHLKILKNVDILVDGAFEMAERDLTLRFRGSRNQRVIDVDTSLKLGYYIMTEEVRQFN